MTLKELANGSLWNFYLSCQADLILAADKSNELYQCSPHITCFQALFFQDRSPNSTMFRCCCCCWHGVTAIRLLGMAMTSGCVMLLMLVCDVHKNESTAETDNRPIMPNTSLNHVTKKRRNMIPANETLSGYYLSHRLHWWRQIHRCLNRRRNRANKSFRLWPFQTGCSPHKVQLYPTFMPHPRDVEWPTLRKWVSKKGCTRSCREVWR